MNIKHLAGDITVGVCCITSVCDPSVRLLHDDKTWLHVLNAIAELRS